MKEKEKFDRLMHLIQESTWNDIYEFYINASYAEQLKFTSTEQALYQLLIGIHYLDGQ